mgnify:CR=1 FL=1
MSNSPLCLKIGYATLIVISFLCAAAGAFEVNKTFSGKEIKWFNLNVPYYINAAGGPYGSSTAIKASMQTWTDVSASELIFSFAGTTSSTDWGENDGKNIVCFGTIEDSEVLAQNILWYYTSTGQMLDSDIKFNSTFSWGTDGSSNNYDIQNVGTHEYGHSVGLADLYAAVDSEKTMYGYSAKGETKKRTLDQDDINGIIYLYGSTSATSTTTSISTSSSIVSTIPTTVPATTTTSIPPLREVDFVGSPVSGYRPLTVTFDNLAKGDITYQYWDFGDGSPISFESNPVHTYKKLGTFTVTLIVEFVDGSKLQMVKENYIAVESRCLFVSSLKNPAQVEKIRKLRTAIADNLYWRELFTIYYRHFFEILLILQQHPQLRDELQELANKHINTVEELSNTGETALREDELNEITAFLLKIKDYGTIGLQADIDAILDGINNTMILYGLGIHKE